MAKKAKAQQAASQPASAAAGKSAEVTEKGGDPKLLAARELAKEIRAEVTAGAGKMQSGVYQDLLYGSFWDVNWTQIAQDLLR